MKVYLSILVLPIFLLVLFVQCTQEESNAYKNPDVKIFVQQLKSDRYNTEGPSGVIELPAFKKSDISVLLFYAKDHTPLKRFPVNPASIADCRGYRLSQCLLWTIEKTRRGSYPSDAPVLVKKNSLTGETVPVTDMNEISEVWEIYNDWWTKVERESDILSVSVYHLNPLEGSIYMWN